MVKVEKNITFLNTVSSIVEDLISNSGGTIRESTNKYTGLNEISDNYWKYHTPYGVQGDEIILREDYRFTKICQTTKGYTITVEYRSGETVSFEQDRSYPLTPDGTFISSESMPQWASRLVVVITDVQMSVDNTEWIFTVSKKVEG
jgi:hypothetical protein